MNQIGELFGWLIIIFYVLTVLNFIVKAINKKYSKQIRKSQNFRNFYNLLMKFVVKNHKIFGIITIVFILSHFIVQFSSVGLNLAGLIAASLMIIQILLGVYGAYINKTRTGLWFKSHRLIAIILAFAIIIHIV